jgi:hypothetical protein
MAKLDLLALNDPSRDFKLIEPRTKWFWISLGSGIFVAVGLLLLSNGEDNLVAAWGAIVFFGLCLVVGLLKLFGKPDWIKFDQNGFTFSNFGKETRFEWRDMTGFGTYKVGPPLGATTMIGINLSESQKSKLTSFNNALVGFEAALPTNYGVKPMDLAMAMQKRMEASQAGR